MPTSGVGDDVEQRIRADLAHFEGSLPESWAIAWRGYLAGLLEWGVLQPSAYDRLASLVPMVEHDPVTEILRGRD